MLRSRMVASLQADLSVQAGITPFFPEYIGQAANLLFTANHPDKGAIELFNTLEGCYQYIISIMCGAVGKYLPVASVVSFSPELNGLLLATETNANEGHIAQIVVQPAHRNKGTGKRLLLTAMALLHDAGYSKVSLNVTDSNTPAIRLYESLGFERE